MSSRIQTDGIPFSLHPRCSPLIPSTLSAIFPMCVPPDLTLPELAQLNAIVMVSRSIKKGATLYWMNDPFKNIYIIRTGSFKTFVVHPDGQDKIIGFHLAGDPLGLDGICEARHDCCAVALEDSSVCAIPFQVLETACQRVKTLQHYVHCMISREIVDESRLLLLTAMPAEKRVAAFLIHLSQRLKTRGYAWTEFKLRMTREEIGSYLGLQLETISRMFSRFQKEGWIDTHGKQIHILNFEKLTNV